MSHLQAKRVIVFENSLLTKSILKTYNSKSHTILHVLMNINTFKSVNNFFVERSG